MEDDPRFSKLLKDPKFRRIPKNEKKVKIDKRFKSMFNDKKFRLKYTVDKRGRPINNTSKEDLKRYYALSSDDSENDEEEEEKTEEREEIEETEKQGEIEKQEEQVVNQISVNKSDKIIPGHIKQKLKDLKIDYARGEGCLYSGSSSDDDESEVENVEEEEGLDHAWGELDRDAERTDEITSRLAACNMDWDRINAVDMMMVLSSFLPTGGLIHSVTIYPSEFGLKRLQEEEVRGPIELVELEPTEGDDDDDGEGSKFHMEKLRQYQLNRLKYYYAVIVCDSKETANHIYTECDGVEYESSSTKLDLRFIPDGETFDQEPKEVCGKLPELGKYKPRYFTTTALQQAKVDLTWDETDPDRVEVADKLAKNKQIEDLDLKAYLATSSEEEDEVENEIVKPVEEEVDAQNPVSVIDKYKALLQEIEDEEESKKQDVVMEVSWGVGFKEKTEKLVKKKLDEKSEKTPFQQYLDKRKEKRKLKREESKKKASKSDEDDDESDDDIPSDVDMNDPYFAEEFNKDEFKKKKRKPKKVADEVDSEDEKAKAELELLLANDDDRNHFSLQKIQEREGESKKSKKKGKKKVQETTTEDNFEIDVGDDRFSALYTSHHFNIDPTDSHYKKTKGIEAIISEKLKRRKETDDSSNVNKNGESSKSAEMNVLVKSLKRKTEAFGYNKKKKMKGNFK